MVGLRGSIWLYGTMKVMGKKNQSKKHKFKHVEPIKSQEFRPAVVAGADKLGVAQAAHRAGQTAGGVGGAVAGRDFRYVLTDLQRIVVLLVALVGVEVVLWYLFAHTGLGSAVYRLVRL